jgi:hypothetical protein
MKTFVRKDISKFIIKKKGLLINLLIVTVVLSFLGAGCIKEDYPARMLYPVLTTTAASSITSSTASMGGNITDDGGSAIIARGVCWSVFPAPSILFADSTTVDGTGTGAFTSNIDGLMADTAYYVRAYATNASVTAYGQEIKILTPPETK